MTLERLHKVEVPSTRYRISTESALLGTENRVLGTESAPPFVREVLGKMIAGEGDSLPVSALPVDGTYPTGTSQYEKRNLATEIPVWDPNVCIQCGKCAMVCPHGIIRIKVYDEECLQGAPSTFRSTNARDKEWQTQKYTIQVAPEDCTGCGICVDVCPARNKSEARLKAINMQPQAPVREQEKENWQFFLGLPEMDRLRINESSIRQQQVQQPLFEFSGACSGLRRNPLHQATNPAFGGPTGGRQRDRLLLDLRRQPAHHTMGAQSRRVGPRLEQLAVRRQRRVRPRLSRIARQAARLRT